MGSYDGGLLKPLECFQLTVELNPDPTSATFWDQSLALTPFFGTKHWHVCQLY